MPKIQCGPNPAFGGCEMNEIIHAAMFYPDASQCEQHQSLAYWFASIDLKHTAWMYNDGEYSYTDRDITVMDRSRSIEQLGGDIALLSRRGFYAAHWLRYSLYAARHAPKLRTIEKWKAFATDSLVEGLPVHWPKKETSLNFIRQRFAPVAHFWLAYVDATYHHKDILTDPVVISERAFEDFWYSEPYQEFMFWMRGRAQAYFQEALEAGLYKGDRRSNICLDDIWMLSDSIAPSDLPALDTPDFWGAYFDPELFLAKYERLRKRGQASDGIWYRPQMARPGRR